MPFPFVYLCDLLNDLELPHVSRYPMLPKDLANYTKEKVIRWLRLHRDRLNAFSTDSEAVMSMLQPEKQTDRVLGLDAFNLEPVIARALSLPRKHYLDLQQWKTEPVRGDLGACVKRVMEEMNIIATPGQANAVTVEEIDQSLLRIAAFEKYSSPAVQSLASSWKYPDGIELLVNMYQRLQAREAKWLTRLILKSYAPIQFPENLEPGPQHSYLPNCVQLKIQFPSSAPAPVRRDGTRLIMGIGAAEADRHTPTSSRIAGQPPSPTRAPATDPSRLSSTASAHYSASFVQRPARKSSQHAISPPRLARPTPAKETAPQIASAVRISAISSSQHAFCIPGLARPAPIPVSSISEPTSSEPTSSTFTAQLNLSTPVSSLPTLTPSGRQNDPSPSILTHASSRPIIRASPNNNSPCPSRTALGTLSQNIPSPGSQKSLSSSPSHSIFTGGTGTCKRALQTCLLRSFIFILGPCIPKGPYMTEELLGGHGCRYITSIRALSHPSLQTRCPQTGKRFRKVALVEPHDKQATIDFLRRIMKSNLTRKGKKETVKVYDWRLLEFIGKIEQGKEYEYNFWARSFICRVS